MSNNNNGNSERWNVSMSYRTRLKLFIFARLFSAKFLVFLVGVVALWMGKIGETTFLGIAAAYCGSNFLDRKYSSTGGAPAGYDSFMTQGETVAIGPLPRPPRED